VPEPGNPQALNRYAYVNNNPLKCTDPSGHWLETAWDILNIGWDLYEVYRDPRNAWNWVALAADVGAAILPVVPGGVGLVVRGGRAAKAGIELATHVDEAADVGRIVAEAASHADEAADALRAVRGSEEAVRSVTKADIIADLSTGTIQSQRIAQAMERGKIGVNILGDELFEKAYRFRGGIGDPSVVDAFAYGQQIYLRRGSSDIFRDAVHEGTHALDYVSGFRGSNIQWEKRAYFYERQFQLYKGRPTEFKRLTDILRHIKLVY